jgi:hypothetical protein
MGWAGREKAGRQDFAKGRKLFVSYKLISADVDVEMN